MNALGRITGIAVASRWKVLHLVLLSLINNFNALLRAGAMMVLIDIVYPAGSDSLAAASVVLAALAGAGSIASMASMLLLLENYTQVWISSTRKRIFSQMVGFTLSYFQRHGCGYASGRLIDDPEAASPLFSRLLSDIVQFAVASVSSGIFLFLLNPSLTLLLLLLVPLYGFVLYRRTAGARGIGEVMLEKRSLLGQTLVEGIRGAVTARVANASSFLTDASRRSYDEVVLQEYRLRHFEMGNTLAYGGIPGLLIPIMVIGIGGMEVLRGNLTIGGLVAFRFVIGTVFESVSRLVGMSFQLQVSLGAWDRVGRTLSEEREPDGGRCLRSASGGVCFEDVWFSYGEKSDPVLRGIGFSVSDGEQVGLVGRSGAGKTTITDLILGFLDPGSGRVLVGGEDICGCSLEDLRKRVGVVPQAPFIFNRSIRDNITLGRSIAPEVLDRVLEESGVDELVSGLPSGLESVAGEGGSLLSGGERQRIAIARALVGEPRILILDEATSALDSVSEERVGRLLCGLKGRCTVIVIAHRLATVATLDRILLLDGGVIAAEGDHACLLETSAAYRDLFGKQIFRGASHE